MEAMNRAIEDVSEFRAFMMQAEGTAPVKPEGLIEEQFITGGNREQRRAAAKAERRAKAKA